jgi:hypothetical protein
MRLFSPARQKIPLKKKGDKGGCKKAPGQINRDLTTKKGDKGGCKKVRPGR